MDKVAQEVKQEEVIEQPVNNVTVSTVEDDKREAMGEETPQPKEVKEESKKENVEDETKPPKKTRSQRRIERQSKELKELREEMEALKQESKPKAKEEAIEPDPSDFEEYEEYEKALEEFKKPKAEPEPKEKKPSAYDKRVAEMTEDGREEYEDFDTLVTAPDLALTQDLLNEILDTDNPSDTLYYLASNKDLTKKVSSMDAKGRAKELLKIEIKLEDKPVVPQKKVTTAPEPINPLNGGSETIRTPETANSYKEYEQLRAKQSKTAW